jgi:hypothetical protein
MSKLFGPQGVKGIDVTTPSGKKAYNADKQGFISVDNPAHARQAKAEGFVEASLFNGIGGNAYPCTGCGFNSVFRKYTCWKCETVNDFTQEQNNG